MELANKNVFKLGQMQAVLATFVSSDSVIPDPHYLIIAWREMAEREAAESRGKKGCAGSFM